MLRCLTRYYPGFVEAPITFAPTYKYDTKSEGQVYSLKRRPAYCDRILCRASRGGVRVECERYERVESRVSDHMAVWAGFKLEMADGEVMEGHPMAGPRDSVVRKRNRRIVKGLVVPAATVIVLGVIMGYLVWGF